MSQQDVYVVEDLINNKIIEDNFEYYKILVYTMIFLFCKIKY